MNWVIKYTAHLHAHLKPRKWPKTAVDYIIVETTDLAGLHRAVNDHFGMFIRAGGMLVRMGTDRPVDVQLQDVNRRFISMSSISHIESSVHPYVGEEPIVNDKQETVNPSGKKTVLN